jgi:hypothetical protein
MDGWGWVVCRFILGLAQMVGAVVGVCLLFQTGISGPTLGTFAVTTLLTEVSRLLFKSHSTSPSPRGR